MLRLSFSRAIEIPAPPALVWSIMADVSRWPEWTSSVLRVSLLSGDQLSVGSRMRILQPKLPSTVWRVTELNRGANFTWISRAPGVTVSARHMVEPIDLGVRATLSISYEGLLGGLLARWVGNLNERYLELEAEGLKKRCIKLQEQGATVLAHDSREG
jgi:hypothetical protein